MNEQLSILEIIVCSICVIGVVAFMWSLFRSDKCTFGGLHKWYTASDYQFLEVKECLKCRETKTVEKVKI